MIDALGLALSEGRIGSRFWIYSNYHCNLACTYCLTESAPDVSRRELPTDTMVELAEEAASLGFTSLGITGGEPFLVPEMPELIARLAQVLPVVVLSNGTLFSGSRLERMRPLGELDVRIQISLDRSEPVANDEMRGPHNFRKVVEAVPLLVGMGVGVRIASTLEVVDEQDMARLCALHRSLGVPDEDHVVRGIVGRGRAKTEGLGQPVDMKDLRPELTVTADGTFWSPFAPTVVGGRLDTDLLVTRAIRPLRLAANAMVGLAAGTAAGPTVDDRFT